MLNDSKVAMRKELIMEAVDACVLGMGDMGMTPPEALAAAEIVLWQFMENGMNLSPTDEIRLQSKQQAARVLARLAARVEAWPAKTTERM